MKQQGLTKWIAAATLIMASAVLPASASDFEKELQVAAGGKLNLQTDAGSVKVLTHNKDSAFVEVEIDGRDAEDFEVTAEVNGDTLDIKGELEGKRWSRSLQVKFVVTVPETFDIEIDTSGGSIKVSDITGDVDARTSGGSIRVGSIKGNVDLDTSGGSIQTKDVHGELNARTSGGSIKATFAKQLEKDAVLDTSGGSITAYLIEDIQIDLDASTSGGRVKTDFDVNGRVKKQSIRGKINGGGPELQLRTSGGSVNVRSL